MPEDKNISCLRKHFRETYELVKKISKDEIATWLLNEGYFPENYVLPPSFRVVNTWKLQNQPYYKDLKNIRCKELLEQVSYPKSQYSYRVFSVIDPKYYHDLVYHIIQNWEFLCKHLFDDSDLKIFSYSFPIPVTKYSSGLTKLRSGRMIYEWIEMAEQDLVIESYRYNFLLKTDILNYYESIYTHIIPRALHNRSQAFRDKGKYNLVGSKLDRLLQYSNDAMTKGIPIGPVISDLISEFILVQMDREISTHPELGNIDFLGARFKDDYRILCQTKEDAEKIIQVIASVFNKYKLQINSEKTQILTLPEGCYRPHMMEYKELKLDKMSEVKFNEFESILMKVIEINKKYPNTSLIKRFLADLYNKNKTLKIDFNYSKKISGDWKNLPSMRCRNLARSIVLLLKLAEKSPQSLSSVLSVIESIYTENYKFWNKNCVKRLGFTFKNFLKQIFENEFERFCKKNSVFETIWIVYFSRYIGLGIDFENILKTKFRKIWDQINGKEGNDLLKSIIKSKQCFFKKSSGDIKSISGNSFCLFESPKKTRFYGKLVDQLDIFERK